MPWVNQYDFCYKGLTGDDESHTIAIPSSVSVTGMYFLVIFICLLVNYLWLKDYDRFDDAWFFRLRARAEQLTSDLAQRFPSGWIFSALLIYAAPLLLLGLLLILVDQRAYGLLTMIVHVGVLLIAFDRIQPGRMAQDFLSSWREGDVDECARYIKRRLAAAEFPDLGDEDALGNFFSKQLIYRWFERMFVMFFWYIPTGPMGVLICYITYQLRDSHRADQAQEEVELVARIIQVLEWLPLRLLALAFSLAGNFESCYGRLRDTFWKFGDAADSADLLYAYARCALSGSIPNPSEPQSDDLEVAREQKAVEIETLHGLLVRSQWIWLTVLALVTVTAAFVELL